MNVIGPPPRDPARTPERAPPGSDDGVRLQALEPAGPAVDVTGRPDGWDRGVVGADVYHRACAFATSLAQRSGDATLPQFIIESLSHATSARVGALAVYREPEQSLVIAATWGYPPVLVEHVRVAPGRGILGSVFASRKPLLVADIQELPGMHPPRPRYRTRSFMALPLQANGETVGVVSVADRVDDRPFEGSDFAALCVFAGPAILALERIRLIHRVHLLERVATVDSLTELFNRGYFDQQLESEIERARRHAVDLALLIVDVDDFKAVNDALGHPAGDGLLRQVAEILRKSVRVFDVCCRYGGEEFAILLPSSDAERATQTAERIRRAVATQRPVDPDQPERPVTVSVGLSILKEGDTAPDLVRRADQALYRAKVDGKNRVRAVLF